GIHRHRLAHGREVVGLQPEGIAGVDAVDADGVVARILAADADLAARLVALGDARIHAHIVLDVAVCRLQRLDLLLLDVGPGPHLVRAEDVRAASHADCRDGAEGRHVRSQRRVDRVHLVQRQVYVVLGLRAFARLGDRDLVRATDAQAAGVVAAAGIGSGAADRARFDVRDDHFRAHDGLAAVVGHQAADTRGGALGENGGCGERSDQTDRQLRQSDAVAVGHVVASMRGWSWWRKPDARRADSLACEADVTGRSVNFRLTH